jgi:hypothetical protein
MQRSVAEGTANGIKEIFNNLTRRIVRLGHGGMILIAKDTQVIPLSSQRGVDCLLLQELLIQYWNGVARLVPTAATTSKLLSKEQIANPDALKVAKNTAMLEKCVDSIAHLAGIDGAIVMDYLCRVDAFNAIISKPTSIPKVTLVNERGIKLPDDVLKNRGSRHQSALSCTIRVPDSFAFVISQDGGISAFHNPNNGKVVCEIGMRVLD